MARRKPKPEREAARAFIAAHPRCVVCQRYTGGQAPHHRIKTAWGGKDEWANLTALCFECHEHYHQKERAWAPDCIKSPSIRAAILGQAAELVAENSRWLTVLPDHVQPDLGA